MPSRIEQSLYIEFEELFSLRERLRSVADQIREALVAAGMRDRLEADLFDQELELRGSDSSNLLIRLDSFHLEVAGLRPGVAVAQLATVILAEAEVFRLTSVEVGFAAWYRARADRPLHLVAQAFPFHQPGQAGDGEESMLDRRFAMTWDWALATTGYSFHANCTEDRELMLGLKAREGYMTLPELHSGIWIEEQRVRFDQAVDRFLSQLGWQS